MPNKKKVTYEGLIAARKQVFEPAYVIDALRRVSDLSMTIAEFLDSVRKSPSVKRVAGHVTLGDVFSSVLDPVELFDVSAPVMRQSKSRKAPKASKKGRAKKKPAAKKKTTRKKKTKKKPAKKQTRRPRVDPAVVAKRLGAIVAVLAKNGDWMKTSDILAAAAKKKALFKGVDSLLAGQYLAALISERPARVKKTGQRGASRYRAAKPAKKTAKKKVVKKATKKKAGKKAPQKKAA